MKNGRKQTAALPSLVCADGGFTGSLAKERRGPEIRLPDACTLSAVRPTPPVQPDSSIRVVRNLGRSETSQLVRRSEHRPVRQRKLTAQSGRH
jgi:hypothetical protein